jgi:uncharacterized protein
MKAINILLLLLAPAVVACGQASDERTKQRYIEVTGSAEEEVTPDETYMRITLREFEKDRVKVTLAELEPGLIRAVQSLKIDPKDLQIENLYGHEYYLHRERNEFFASKSYRLRLRNLNLMDSLVGKLDKIGVKELGIERVYSKMEELRRKVKTDAVKAAKHKAEYLLQALNENLGKALAVTEINNDPRGYPMPAGALSYHTKAMDAAESLPDLNSRTVKVRYEMLVRFEIK